MCGSNAKKREKQLDIVHLCTCSHEKIDRPSLSNKITLHKAAKNRQFYRSQQGELKIKLARSQERWRREPVDNLNTVLSLAVLQLWSGKWVDTVVVTMLPKSWHCKSCTVLWFDRVDWYFNQHRLSEILTVPVVHMNLDKFLRLPLFPPTSLLYQYLSCEKHQGRTLT